MTTVFDVVIAAGGASRRMGTDKAAIMVNGVALLHLAVGAAAKAGARRILVVGGDSRTSAESARFVADSHPGSGPFAALIDGLGALATEDTEDECSDGIVVFVAVDHPELQSTEIVALAQRLATLPAHVLAVIPEVDGRSQPLHGAYRTSAVGPLAAILATGERSLWRALLNVAVDRPDRSSGPGAASYRDLDDPRQLASYLSELHHQTDRRERRSVGEVGDQPVVSPAMNVPVPGTSVGELGAALRGGSLLVDVREPQEYLDAHVGTARLVPLQTVPTIVDELPAGEPVYVICHLGGRSHQAAAYLRQHGIDAVNVLGGTAAWIAAGLPFEQGPEAGPAPADQR